MTPTNPTVIEDQFVEFMGQVAEMCAFNRSIGQIYGILYISPNPLCLEDIANACRMSKGNASVHLRTLENWGAVRQTSKPGSRKDYYSANTDLRALAIKRLQKGTARRLDHAKQRIKAIKEDPAFSESFGKPETTHRKTRLDEIESMIQQAQTGLAFLSKIF